MGELECEIPSPNCLTKIEEAKCYSCMAICVCTAVYIQLYGCLDEAGEHSGYSTPYYLAEVGWGRKV